MIVLVNSLLLRKRFNGMSLWPFILVRTPELKKDQVFINHEKIHARQQIELLIIPFYFWYGIEFLIRLIQYKNRDEAYRDISFEREAYTNEKDLDYLKRSSFWEVMKYF